MYTRNNLNQEVYNLFVCKRCFKKLNSGKDVIPLQAIRNSLDLGNVPTRFQNMNYIEIRSVSLINIFFTLVKLEPSKTNSQLGTKGKVAHIINNIASWVNVLPREPNSCGIVYWKTNYKNSKEVILKEYPYNVELVWDLLLWLKKNNPFYENVQLDEAKLNKWKTSKPVHAEFPQNTFKIFKDKNDQSKVTNEGKNKTSIDGDDEDKINDEEEEEEDIIREVYIENLASGPDDSDEVKNIHEAIKLKLKENNNKSIKEAISFPIQHNVTFINPYEMPYGFWERAFPLLYPYGRGGPFDPNRSVPFHRFSDYVKHMILYKKLDNSILIVFYRFLLQKKASHLAYVSSKLQKEKSELTKTDLDQLLDYTKEGKQRNINADMERLLGQVQIFGGSIPGTSMNNARERKKFKAMTDSPELSRSVWFLTLSSQDRCWPELFMAIDNSLTYETAKLLSYDKRTKLLAENPVLAVMMYFERIDVLLKFILGPSHPIGKVSDYGGKHENQGRGSFHLHLQVWAYLLSKGRWFSPSDLQSKIDDEMTEDIIKLYEAHIKDNKNPKEFVIKSQGLNDVAEIFGSYIIASVPKSDGSELKPFPCESFVPFPADSSNHPSLDPIPLHPYNSREYNKDVYNLVIANQHHVDTRSCFKSKKDPFGILRRGLCRFDFERIIHLINEFGFGKKPNSSTWLFKMFCQRNNGWINNASLNILPVLRANNDLTPIMGYGVLDYIIGNYILKVDASENQVLSEKILNFLDKDPNMTENKKVYLTSMCVLGHREVSLQEIAAVLLGKELMIYSRDFIEIDIRPLSIRNKIISNFHNNDGNNSSSVLISPKYLNELYQFMDIHRDCILKLPAQDLSFYYFLTRYKKSNDKSTKNNELSLYSSDRKIFFKRVSKSRILVINYRRKYDLSDQLFAWYMLILHHSHYRDINELGAYSDAVSTLEHKTNNLEMAHTYQLYLDHYEETSKRRDQFMESNKRMSEELNQQQAKENEQDEATSKFKSNFNLNSDNDDIENFVNDHFESNLYDDDLNLQPTSSKTVSSPSYISSNTCNTSNASMTSAINQFTSAKANGIKMLSSNDMKILSKFLSILKSKEIEINKELLQSYSSSINLHDPSTAPIPNIMNMIDLDQQEIIEQENISMDNHNISKANYLKYKVLLQKMHDAPEQMIAFSVIQAYIDGLDCCKTTTNAIGQLRIFISGQAGTGKSLVIETVAHYVRMKFPYKGSKFGPVIICAFMGVSALNVHGKTIDSTFPITEYKGYKGKAIPHDFKLRIQRDFGEVKLIIFDELGNIPLLLVYVSEILQVAKDNFQYDYGGVHVIMGGEFYQLPPTKVAPLYKSKYDRYDVTIQAKNWKLYDNTETYIELFKLFRQQENQNFIDLLKRIRLGRANEEDIALLAARTVPSLHSKDLRKLPFNALIVTSTNKNMDNINSRHLQDLSKKNKNYNIINIWASFTKVIKSVNKTTKSHINNKVNTDDNLDIEELNIIDRNLRKQLLEYFTLDNVRKRDSRDKSVSHVQLVIGARVMVTENLLSQSLVNGTTGILITLYTSMS